MAKDMEPIAASSILGLPVAEVLEDFGECIAPALMKMFGHLLLPEWRTIDVIDNTEGMVHSLVRVNPGAKRRSCRLCAAPMMKSF